MKTCLTVITLLITLFLFSQPVTTIYNGQSVFVYPYRVNNTGSYDTDNRLLGFNYCINVPYYPGTLPDGEYIAWWEKPDMRYNKKTKEYFYLPGDTIKVAVLFDIRDNKKEGKSTWFDSDKGRPYQKGTYKNNLKEGDWVINYDHTVISFHYEQGLLDGYYTKVDRKNKIEETAFFKLNRTEGKRITYHKKRIVGIREYENGILNGPYLSKSEDGYVIKGTYKKGESNGAWDYFYPNGNLMKRINYDTLVYQLGNDSSSWYGDDSLTMAYISQILGKVKLFENYYHMYGNYAEYYYPNGRLAVAACFLNNRIKYPYVLYDKKGKPLTTVTFLRITDSIIPVFIKTSLVNEEYQKEEEFYLKERIKHKIYSSTSNKKGEVISLIYSEE